ncbi:hypothetical protein [Clostridium cylindrosporum]|uniref:Uncharacterized protein n=1 Tax=Clostridium cylindrosporum DSM 605 TaxID=1121307 RepID=A0A0J8DFS7_CLOCY|nr:hypothetical protein [Clostridium cylindrosporum]KMT23013.1 hypothetical protein CLCY_7c00600 [Clostridium cylindrosporum DSM 605]
MIRRGTISTIDNIKMKARVTFPDLGSGVSSELPIAENLFSLKVNDTVVVAFWGNNLSDAVIIAKVRG